MSWNEVLNTVNGQLDKVKEFRYFALFASFLFFLDFNLLIFNGISVYQLSYQDLNANFSLGQVTLFFMFFAFFMSFVVPLVQFMLRFIQMLVPFRVLYFFHHDQWDRISPDDYFYLNQLHRFAVKNDNSTAHEYYKSLVLEREKDKQLNYFCLALIVSVALDFYAFTLNGNGVISWLVPYFTDEGATFRATIVSLLLWSLLVFSAYFGVVRWGGFSLDDNDKVYFPNNEFRDS